MLPTTLLLYKLSRTKVSSLGELLLLVLMALQEYICCRLVLGAGSLACMTMLSCSVGSARWNQVVEQRLNATLGSILTETHGLVELLGSSLLFPVVVGRASL